MKIRKDTAYQRMFKAAFGDATINSQRMLKALAQFTGNLISYNSKYDKVQRAKPYLPNMNKGGYQLFKTQCAACHPEPLFTDNSFRNNGLSLNRFRDIGRQGITGLPADSLKFKVPTLRNVQVSFPICTMAGSTRFYQVVEHYRSGIDTLQPTLDPLLRKRIEMTNKQKMNLSIFFIHSPTAVLSVTRAFTRQLYRNGQPRHT